MQHIQLQNLEDTTLQQLSFANDIQSIWTSQAQAAIDAQNAAIDALLANQETLGKNHHAMITSLQKRIEKLEKMEKEIPTYDSMNKAGEIDYSIFNPAWGVGETTEGVIDRLENIKKAKSAHKTAKAKKVAKISDKLEQVAGELNKLLSNAEETNPYKAWYPLGLE